jgi:hypothetical protein
VLDIHRDRFQTIVTAFTTSDHRLEHFPTSDHRGRFHSSARSGRVHCAIHPLWPRCVVRLPYSVLLPWPSHSVPAPILCRMGRPPRSPIHLARRGHDVHRATTTPSPLGGGRRWSGHPLLQSPEDTARGRGGLWLRLGVRWAVALNIP